MKRKGEGFGKANFVRMSEDKIVTRISEPHVGLTGRQRKKHNGEMGIYLFFASSDNNETKPMWTVLTEGVSRIEEVGNT
jgi:hypothetical protein